MILYFKKDGRVVKVHYNILSDIINHDSLFVKNSILKLKKESWFTFSEINIWMDAGPHFKSKENLFNMISLFKKVTLNFF